MTNKQVYLILKSLLQIMECLRLVGYMDLRNTGKYDEFAKQIKDIKEELTRIEQIDNLMVEPRL